MAEYGYTSMKQRSTGDHHLIDTDNVKFTSSPSCPSFMVSNVFVRQISEIYYEWVIMRLVGRLCGILLFNEVLGCIDDTFCVGLDKKPL